MLYIQLVISFALSLVLNNTILGEDVTTLSDGNAEVTILTPQKLKTKKEAIDTLFSNSEPLPGSHFDENYRVVIDDPVVYQKALEEEKSNSKNPILESNEVKPEPEFKLFSWETLIGGIIGAVILFSSILICQINDYFKKKK